MDELIKLLFGNIDSRILTIILINGFLIFYLYFYNSSIWKNLSDFDKLFFSTICGWAIYLGIIFPITDITSQIHFLINSVETTKITGDEIWAVYKLFTISILMILIFVRLFISDKPIYDNIKLFKGIFKAGLCALLALIIICIEFGLIMLFSPFKEYASQFGEVIIPSLTFAVLFTALYFAIHKKILWVTLKCILQNTLYILNSKKPIIIALFLILTLLIPYCAGQFLLNYEYSVTDEYIQNVTIKKVDIQRDEIESANEVILRKYSVKMPRLFLWAKIKPELPIQNESNLNYTVNEAENAIFVNKTSDVVNFTATLYKETNISYPEIITSEEFTYSNESLFINISLNNSLSHIIFIEDLSITIPTNYSLDENSFIETQSESVYGISGYAEKGNVLYLTKVRIYPNSSGIISLELINQTAQVENKR